MSDTRSDMYTRVARKSLRHNPRRAFRVASFRRGWARNRQGFMLTQAHGSRKLHQLFKFLNADVFLNDDFRHGCAKWYQTRTFYGVLDWRKLVQVGLNLCGKLRGATGHSIRSLSARNFLPALVPATLMYERETHFAARETRTY